MVAPKKICPCPNRWNLVTLFGKEVFAHMIKLTVLKQDHSGLSEWALNPMTSVIPRGERQREI